MAKRTPYSKTHKRTKRAMAIRLSWKIRKGRVDPPNDKENIGPTVDKQDLKYLSLVNAEAADIKQENIEIDIQDELQLTPATTESRNDAFHSREKLSARKAVKRTPYSKRSKRTKRAMAIRLSWKIRKGLVDPPNDVQNIGPTVDKQDLKYLSSVNAEAAYIKQETFDYEELHHEIDIKDEFPQKCEQLSPATTEDRNAAFHSKENLCACGFRERKTENGNYQQEHSHVHESEKQFICMICYHKTVNRNFLLLHKKITRVKNCLPTERPKC